MLGNTTIYGLGFVEGGNAWYDAKKFNPFSLKRSAGLGVRIFLPMVGLMGIDYAYGFDKDTTGKERWWTVPLHLRTGILKDIIL